MARSKAKPRVKLGAKVKSNQPPFHQGVISAKYPRPGVKYPWYVKWNHVNYLPGSNGDGPYANSELTVVE